MWKEWTNKIKNFAEDIASPDYDEETEDGRIHYKEKSVESGRGGEGRRLSLDAHPHGHQRDAVEVTGAATYSPINRVTVGGGDDGSASRLGTRGDRYADAGGHVDAVVNPQAVVSTFSRSTAAMLDETRGRDLATSASSSFPPCSGTEVASRSVAEPRGPPLARVTPHSPLTSSQSPELKPPPSPVAPALSLPPAKCAGLVFSAPTATTALSSRSSEQHHPWEQLPHTAALEAEKAQLLRDMSIYQEEVRAAHERTVQYYEEKLRAAAATTAASAITSPRARDTDAQQQVRDLQAALHRATSELEGERTLRVALQVRFEDLQQEAQSLRASLATARKEIAAMADSAAATAPSPAAPTEAPSAISPPVETDWRQQHEDELHMLRTALKEKDTLLEAQAVQLKASETTCRSLGAQLQEALSKPAAVVTERRKSSSVDQDREEDAAAPLEHEEAHSNGVTSTFREVTPPNSLSTATAAAPAAHQKEQPQVANQLTREAVECRVLQQEVERLTEAIGQLQSTLDTQEREHAAAVTVAQAAHSEVERTLQEKLNAVEMQLAQSTHVHKNELRHLQVQLEEEQKHAQLLDAEKKVVENARSAAEAQAGAAERRCAHIQMELEAVQQRLKQLEEEGQKRKHESDAKQSDTSISVAALTKIKKELVEKVETLELTNEELRRMTVDTLVRLGVDMQNIIQQTRAHSSSVEHKPSGNDDDDQMASNTEEEKKRVDACTELTLPQLFSFLITECLQQHSIVLRAERVQQEWEQTYEQARRVNDSLNQQVADAWSTIGKLREEVSAKDETARRMQSRVGSGDARLVEVQEQLAGALHELESLREEREGWVTRLQQAETGAEVQANTLSSLEEELRAHQEMIQAKDAELQASLQCSENLQLVLDRFQEHRRQEVEALTLELQIEAEELKKQLSEARRIMEQHESKVDAVRKTFERQLALKDAEVTTMHLKLAEVRKVLEKTTSRHMDSSETSIDKRVVSQLLAKYIHAFIGQQKESEDMLKVLSGLLDWDEATQEVAGLLPGPNNPQPPGGSAAQRAGTRNVLFSWLHKTEGTSAPPHSAKYTDVAAQTKKAGLASMWVQFLLNESEEGVRVNGPANHDKDDVTVSPLVSPAPCSVPDSRPDPLVSPLTTSCNRDNSNSASSH
ncbi:hypothetical protein JKF63_02298 [Porcisia hertigi]|uniref:GRIP domain-containing protein n=1 Tax=Porcisia hertigi TaxID=2761500 RepID=A0A836I7X8_9TRYP|nr:hypothetical protein JKF63_02298 [Porcisia hertigi]